jgi:hypothetical protein
MSLESLFSVPLYKESFKEHEKFKNLILPHLLEAYNKAEGSNVKIGWNSDLFSTYFDQDVHNFGQLRTVTKDLVQEFLPIVTNAIKAMGLNPATFSMGNVATGNHWYNVYGPGQNQEKHSHIPSSLSLVYSIQFNEEFHSPIVLYNPINWGEARRFSMFAEEEQNKVYVSELYQDRHIPLYDEGDVLIFPSELEHAVFPQEPESKDYLRMTYSMNIELFSNAEATFIREREEEMMRSRDRKLEGSQSTSHYTPSSQKPRGQGYFT